MEKIFEQLIASAKKNKKGLRLLKQAAVRCQQFEAANKFREMEMESFPESTEVKAEKQTARQITVSLSMVGLTVKDDTGWLAYHAIKKYIEMRGEFSLKDASEITARHTEIFDIDE